MAADASKAETIIQPKTPSPEEMTAMAGRLSDLMERSQKVWAGHLENSVEDIGEIRHDPLNTGPVLQKLALEYMNQPQKVMQASLDLWSAQADLWTRVMTGAFSDKKPEPLIQPEKGDRRFKDDMWNVPFFDYLKQSYLLTGKWLQDRLEHVETLDQKERKKLELLTHNFIAALAPSNHPALNPEVLKATIEEKGDNLLRGVENMVRDLERGEGVLMIRQTDMEAFQVGENIAVTPGKVVYQNELIQLIQYAPTTDKVHETPVLFIPPWINKFYILDLNEKKSMIRWMVEQGHTVFVVSWVNPTQKHKRETWESYMKKGVLTAVEKVLEETGVKQTNIVGYCIGGTMLGCTLAHMAANGDNRIKSATFFTAQLDFSDAGDLQAFIDEKVLETLEGKIGDKGVLEAKNMFHAFNCLRANDLIWGFAVNNYLLGKDNFPFDLLYWNSDSTAMPGKLHLYYLEEFYHRNGLTEGTIEIDGEPLDLSKVKVPSYHIAAVEDHIAPAASAYRGVKLLGGDKTFILAGSGHIAGIVNPPAAEKYQYWTKDGTGEKELDDWRKDAEEHPGSWWPEWSKWLATHSKKKVAAREPGAKLGTIEDAPGSYVKQRADESQS